MSVNLLKCLDEACLLRLHRVNVSVGGVNDLCQASDESRGDGYILSQDALWIGCCRLLAHDARSLILGTAKAGHVSITLRVSVERLSALR